MQVFGADFHLFWSCSNSIHPLILFINILTVWENASSPIHSFLHFCSAWATAWQQWLSRNSYYCCFSCFNRYVRTAFRAFFQSGHISGWIPLLSDGRLSWLHAGCLWHLIHFHPSWLQFYSLLVLLPQFFFKVPVWRQALGSNHRFLPGV